MARKTLHLTLQISNPFINTYETPNSHKASFSKYTDLYSHTRCALAGATAMSNSKITTKKIYNKNGDITKYGISRGYIQVSPFYPKTHLYLSSTEDAIYTVSGTNESGRTIHKTFIDLKVAREYLKSTH
jgi:hypothetical protein